MGVITRILLTIICLLFAWYSTRIGRRKHGYKTDIDTLEIERRTSSNIAGYICAILFLLPLVSCWFPEWAEEHNWNTAYVGILSLFFIVLVVPKLVDEDTRNEIDKRSNGKSNYSSAS